MKQMNKMEIRITSQRFRKAANNLYRCNFRDYGVKLNRFLECAENERLIREFLDEIVTESGLTTQDAIDAIEAVKGQFGAIFWQYESEIKEAAWVYLVLKEASKGSYNIPKTLGQGYSSGTKYQEWCDAFNNRFVSTLIDVVNSHLEELLISTDDKGDALSIAVHGNNNQVNLADHGSSVQSIHNSGVDNEALKVALDSFLAAARELMNDDDYETAEEFAALLLEEVDKERPKKHLIKHALDALKTLAAGVNLGSSIITIAGFLQPLIGQ